MGERVESRAPISLSALGFILSLFAALLHTHARQDFGRRREAEGKVIVISKGRKVDEMKEKGKEVHTCDETLVGGGRLKGRGP